MPAHYRPLVWLLYLPAIMRAQGPPQPPSAAEREAMIADVRQKALAYSESLPDFICTQLTDRYSAPMTGGAEPAWALRDRLTIRLTYFGQKEDYRVVQVNGKATNKTLGQVGGWSAKGDFGSMVRGVFDAKSEATIEWERWDTWNGRPVAVLAYRIDRVHSKFSSGKQFVGTKRAIWPARGSAFVDAETRQVIRLTIDSEDMPAESPTREVHIALEYRHQKIGDREFLLPSRSVSRMVVKDRVMRLDSQFTAYQKFSADTEIKYSPAAEEKPPVKK
jgi:hypothetical protein